MENNEILVVGNTGIFEVDKNGRFEIKKSSPLMVCLGRKIALLLLFFETWHVLGSKKSNKQILSAKNRGQKKDFSSL